MDWWQVRCFTELVFNFIDRWRKSVAIWLYFTSRIRKMQRSPFLIRRRAVKTIRKPNFLIGKNKWLAKSIISSQILLCGNYKKEKMLDKECSFCIFLFKIICKSCTFRLHILRKDDIIAVGGYGYDLKRDAKK